MANGSPNSPRSSGLFSGVILLVLGVLLLFHNYGHLEIGSAFKHWWPLILVVWGLIKLYERTVASRQGRSSGWITAGEVFLVIGLLSLVGVVIIVDMVKGHVETGDIFKVIPDVRDSISFDKELPPQKIPANARIQINTTHGDLTVRSADSPELRVTGKANVKAWDENSAGKLAEPVTIEVAKEGEVYVVRPAGFNARDGRIGMDLEVTVPQKSGVTLHNEKGDLHVSDIASDVIISTQKGDIEVSDTGGSVNIDTKGGDTTVSDTKGDVKISGKGGEISVVNATGGLTIEGEFYGPIRADKVTKGVRFISQRTDFTLTQLSGHLETGSGRLASRS